VRVSYSHKIVWDSTEQVLRVLDKDNVCVGEFEVIDDHLAIQLLMVEQEVTEESRG